MGPHPPTVAFHDPPDGREPDSSSRELRLGVEPLEGSEQASRVRLVEAVAVVLHVEQFLSVLFDRAELDPRRGRLLRELPCVADEVLQHDLEESRVRLGHEAVGNDEVDASVRARARERVADLTREQGQVHALTSQVSPFVSRHSISWAMRSAPSRTRRR